MHTPSGGLGRILLTVLVIALSVLAYINYTKRVELANELQNLTVKMDQVQKGNPQQSAAAAKQTVDRVRRLFAIPKEIDPTVAQIVDVNALKAKNSFYADAKNGDYLVVTTTRAILYDPDKDMIIDVVPVQLQQAQPPASSVGALRSAASSAR